MFNRVAVDGGNADGCRPLMMHLVNVLVYGRVVEQSASNGNSFLSLHAPTALWSVDFNAYLSYCCYKCTMLIIRFCQLVRLMLSVTQSSPMMKVNCYPLQLTAWGSILPHT